jgi:hypothetical protein
MELSDNMKIVKNASDEEFIVFARYIRYAMVPRWEEKILFDMINERLAKHNMRMEWGCCGTNQILRRDEL